MSIFSVAQINVSELWQTLLQFGSLSMIAKTFLTLFVIIDPIGLVPLFITLAGDRTPEEQTQIARRAVLVSAGILLAFSLSGSFLLRYLEISIEAFQIAAGILLLKIGVSMVFDDQAQEPNEAQKRGDVSIFPLAVPLIAGPGTLASLLLLLNRSSPTLVGSLQSAIEFTIILAVSAIVLLITYGLLALAKPLAALLGETGINVVTRIIGVLLAALAIQYIADGAIELLKTGLGEVLQAHSASMIRNWIADYAMPYSFGSSHVAL